MGVGEDTAAEVTAGEGGEGEDFAAAGEGEAVAAVITRTTKARYLVFAWGSARLFGPWPF